MGTALVVIDVQKGIDESEHWGGNRNNLFAEDQIKRLLHFWRSLHLPVFIIQHCSASPTSPFRPGYNGNDLKEFVGPGPNERLIKKSHTNAFIETNLQELLQYDGIDELVLCGFVTNNSVEATARMAGDLGFKVTVLSDATATFDKRGIDGTVYSSELIHQISLANLRHEYAEVKKTEEVMREYGLKSDQVTPINV